MLLTPQQAATESQRCLYCFDAPCTQACPVHIDIPKFIAMIKSGNVVGAAKVVKTSHALANVCGKVCPEEIFCQSVCNRAKQDSPIQIRELHFFATQHEARKGFSPMREFPKIGKTAAVIGAGPAGLGCAFELSKFGYDVHVFDAKKSGGVPRNSIPTSLHIFSFMNWMSTAKHSDESASNMMLPLLPLVWDWIRSLA